MSESSTTPFPHHRRRGQTVKIMRPFLQEKHCDVTVVTPNYKGVTDHYPFEVFRYHSIPLDKRIGYRAGNPFFPRHLDSPAQPSF